MAFRAVVLNNILATDMARHGEYTTKLKRCGAALPSPLAGPDRSPPRPSRMRTFASALEERARTVAVSVECAGAVGAVLSRGGDAPVDAASPDTLGAG